MFAWIGCHRQRRYNLTSENELVKNNKDRVRISPSQQQERAGFHKSLPANQSRVRQYFKWLGVLALVAFNPADFGAAAARELAFEFATAAQAREIVGRNDDYIAKMSPFDRSARLKTDR